MGDVRGATTREPSAGIRAAGRLAVGPGRRRRQLAWTAAGLAVVLLAGVGALHWRTRTPDPGTSPGILVPSQGNAHVPTADTPHAAYNSTPPTSGPHLPYIAPWGVHSRPIPPELQVHNLEDGGVVVSYQPECAGRVLDRLTAIVGRYPQHLLLAPYPGLPRCITLTAWTRIEPLDDIDEARIVRFIEAYRGIDHHPR